MYGCRHYTVIHDAVVTCPSIFTGSLHCFRVVGKPPDEYGGLVKGIVDMTLSVMRCGVVSCSIISLCSLPWSCVASL